MTRSLHVRFAQLSLALGLTVLPLAAQNPFGDLGSHPDGAKHTAVTYLFPEQITITANKPSPVDLHFKVGPGLHVNSHTPHTEEFIPTTFDLPESSGVRLEKVVFPPGTEYAFSLNPKEKLSVYTGEFIVHAELLASKGDHLVQATMRYQACTSDTCMPPHSIPVAIDVIAK
jgi:cytochrome c biogenesis DsbD-like protein